MRWRALANATAAWTMPCSFFALEIGKGVLAGERAVLFEGLAETGDVAVAEDAPHTVDEAVFDAVTADVLTLRESCTSAAPMLRVMVFAHAVNAAGETPGENLYLESVRSGNARRQPALLRGVERPLVLGRKREAGVGISRQMANHPKVIHAVARRGNLRVIEPGRDEHGVVCAGRGGKRGPWSSG